MDEQEHTWERLYEYLKRVKPYTNSMVLDTNRDWIVSVCVEFISQDVWEEFGVLSPWVGEPELRWNGRKSVYVRWSVKYVPVDVRRIRADWERLG